jgi:ABC-type multidrug transport system fused ATPase/permease subunit
MADFGATLTDSLASVRVMRAHDAAAAWSELVRAEAARVREVRRAFVRSTSGLLAALGVVAVLAVLGVVLAGRAVGMSTAELAALAVVATRLLASSQTLVLTAQGFGNDAPALERLRDFAADIHDHPERPASPAATASGRQPGTDPVPTAPLVSLRGVSVRYAGEDRPALDGVDLDVPRQGLVGVVGPSGAGKSTLVDLLLGLLRPAAGTVLVDGHPRTDLPRWRARLGYVPQQTALVPGTVWQNLAWSLQPGRALTEEAAWAALRTACLDEVVGALDGGLQASLDEVAGLSGGEQQRLMVARALVRDPELLVLDEATAGLDAETEARVVERLLRRGGAVVMVTHRTAPLAAADAVLRLDAGRVVEAVAPV